MIPGYRIAPLGTSLREATMIYAHLSESRLKQAVAKLDEPYADTRGSEEAQVFEGRI
jgi:hypothetical protein